MHRVLTSTAPPSILRGARFGASAGLFHLITPPPVSRNESWFTALLQRLARTPETSLVVQALDALRRNPALGEVPFNHLRDMARLMHYRDYKEGEYVYHADDPGLGLYLVQEGGVRLYARAEDGEMAPVLDVGPFETFGEESLLGEFRRKETVQVVGPTRLLGFFRPDLKVLGNRRPKAANLVVLALARHVVARERRMIEAVAARQGRVEALRAAHGAPSGDGRVVTPRPRAAEPERM